MKEAFQHMMEILAKLEEKNIYYKLDMVSTKHDRILIEIAIPGERWEIEIDHESNVFIEKFFSDGTIYPEDELDKMLDSSDK